MTKNSALQIATETINACDLSSFTSEQKAKINDALDIIASMREQLSKKHVASDEVKAKRKEKSATERANAIKDVLPIVRETIVNYPNLTAKEIYKKCNGMLPEGWNANRVQYLLLHEMSNEVLKVETKGKANTYYIA